MANHLPANRATLRHLRRMLVRHQRLLAPFCQLGRVRDLLEREFAQNGNTGAGLERRPYATARPSSDAGHGTFTLPMYINAFHGWTTRPPSDV